MSWKIELWDQPEYASGASRVGMVDQWTAGTMKLAVDGTDTLQLIAPWNADWFVNLLPRRVLKITDELGRVTEWRIIRVLDGRGGDRADVSIEAESLLAELARPLVLQTQAGGATAFSFNVYDSTAAQIFDQFIAPRLTAEGLGHFVRGTFTPTEPMTFAWSRFSCLELLSELADRTLSERWIERDDANTRYLVHLGTRGSAEPTVRTAFNRGNLETYVRDRDSLLISTVTIPTGKKVDGAAEDSTLGFNAWNVVSVTGTTLELEDPAGSDAPIAFDDQLNGLYALRPLDVAVIDITDSSATGQTVTLASVPQGATYATQSAKDFSPTGITLPTGTATGDIVVAAAMCSRSLSASQITSPTGWTTVLDNTYNKPGDVYYGSIWVGYVTWASGVSTSISFVGSDRVVQAFLLTNVAASGAVKATATGRADSNVAPQDPMVATGAGTVQLYLGGYLRGDVGGDTGIDSDYKENLGPGKSFTHTLSANSAAPGGVAASVSWVAGVAVAGTGVGIVPGEHVQILGTSSGALAYELTSPTGVSTYGRVIGTVADDELREERNWIANGTFTTWGTGLVASGFTTSPSVSVTMERDYANNMKTFRRVIPTSSVATGSDYRVVMTVPTGSVLSYGDLVASTGVSTVRTYVKQFISSTGSTVTVITDDDPRTGVSTGANPANIVAGGPESQASVYTTAHNLPKAADLNTVPIRVKYFPGYSTLWGSVGFTTWQKGTSIATATGGIFDLRLVVNLLETGTTDTYTNDFGAVSLGGQTYSLNTPVEIGEGSLRVAADITEDSDVTLQFRTSALTGGDEFHMVRWMQLHLGTDSQVPPVSGSHGNRIWQRGNQHLRVFGTPPSTYKVSLLDLVRGQEAGLAIADDGIALGGAVRLVDPLLGETDLRIVELRLNAVDPYDSQVTLANIPPRLAKIARRARFAPPTRPDPTPPVQKPAAEEPGAPLPTILAPEIGVTAPATIKLVGGTWSIYA